MHTTTTTTANLGPPKRASQATDELANRLNALRAIERKLERWELQHLREHAAQQDARIQQLQEQLDAAREAADDADSRAEYWREQVLQLNDELSEDLAIGLGKDGSMRLVSRPPNENRPVVVVEGPKAGKALRAALNGGGEG